MKALVLGKGYVGSIYASLWPCEALSRDEGDYTRPERLNLILKHRRPEVVINCAGFTGRPHIDECEVKRAETIQANIVLAANVSQVCEDLNIPLVHISSGCIYQGSKSFTEDDPPAKELSFYSLTKALSEEVVNGYILRIRMPFGDGSHKRSFIRKIMGYPKLINQENSLTYLPDLVSATDSLLTHQAPTGVYNVVNKGSVTHKEIVQIFRFHGHDWWEPEFIHDKDLQVKAPRSNCTLDNSKLSAYFQMPDVRDRLNQVAIQWPPYTHCPKW